MSIKESLLIDKIKKEDYGEEAVLLYDKSLVHINQEKPEKAALQCLLNSLLNNIVMTCAKLIMTINLILIGHITYENKVHYQLFMTFQIGVFILEFLGKFFLLGLIKYVFFEKKDFKQSYNSYIKIKAVLIFLIPAIFIPVSICSYFLIELLLKESLDINDQSINKEVYKQYLLYTPAIYLFEILFFFNIKYLNMERVEYVIKYIIPFLICHAGGSWITIYFFEMGLSGLTLFYGLNSFIFFFCSDKCISELLKDYKDNFFTLIPNKSHFDNETLTIMKHISFYSLINLGDIIVPSYIFLASAFIDKNTLIVNIIYLNFFELLVEINRSFYYSIKRDIITKDQDAKEKQMIISYFSLYYFILTLAIIIVLLLFNNILLKMYLFKGGEPILLFISSRLRVIYPICIFCMSLRLLLNGIIRGMNLPLSYLSKTTYIIISIAACYIFCFEYDFGIKGLWLAMLIFDIFYIFESAHKTIKHFPLIITYSSGID